MDKFGTIWVNFCKKIFKKAIFEKNFKKPLNSDRQNEKKNFFPENIHIHCRKKVKGKIRFLHTLRVAYLKILGCLLIFFAKNYTWWLVDSDTT